MGLELKKLLARNRTCRRFDQGYPVFHETLKEIVELTRYIPSAGNLQPLKFVLSSTAERNNVIFPHLRWAAYLKDWPGPEDGERPAAYILILGDSSITKAVKWDHSIAALAVTLGAAEKGLGACIFGSFDHSGLRKGLAIPDQFDILLVVALGKPAERVVLEKIGSDGDVRYWRDSDMVHHVPKRSLDDLILDL